MKQRTYSSLKPEKGFDIGKVENGECTVLFFDNIQEEKQEMPNLENEEIIEITTYSYDTYTIEVTNREGLAEKIENDFENWLKFVKEKDYNEVAAEVRAKRNELLAETDSEMCLDRMGLEVPEGTSFTAWLAFLKTIAGAITGKMSKYRQELRDITLQKDFPYNVIWPTMDKED